MRKILLSLLTVSAVAVVAVTATGAFFNDVETSQDNTLTAGELDLKVNNACHYWTDVNADGTFIDVGCDPDGGGPIVTDWLLSDLVPGVHTFFSFHDVKPGDSGEDTVSLRVFDNDSWGRLVISNVQDLENGCTEPENDVPDPSCGAGNDEGELRENLSFWVWLDQGTIPGFQCPDGFPGCLGTDHEEGDNIWQEDTEPPLITPGLIVLAGETHNIWDGLALAASTYGTGGGLHIDGHMEGNITYYFGIGWDLPSTVGNIVQTDSLSADMAFEVEQYRNNPTPF
jgi:predicted ribosomally synthesized peptide with SipW-like signal peptide